MGGGRLPYKTEWWGNNAILYWVGGVQGPSTIGGYWVLGTLGPGILDGVPYTAQSCRIGGHTATKDAGLSGIWPRGL